MIKSKKNFPEKYKKFLYQGRIKNRGIKMADKKHLETSKIDALYQWLSYDLQRVKTEIMSEMKYSSVQIGSLYQEIKNDKDKSSQAIAQEIRYSYKQNQTIYDGLSHMITDEIAPEIRSMDEKMDANAEKVGAIDEKLGEANAKLDANAEKMLSVEEKLGVLDELKALVSEVSGKVAAEAEKENTVDAEEIATKIKEYLVEILPAFENVAEELKYSYLQQQSVYDGLTALIESEVISKLNAIDEKTTVLEQIDKALDEINNRLAEGFMPSEEDYKKLVDSVAEKTEETVSEHSRQVMDAVLAIPVAENVDYTRIVDEVGDKVLELIAELKTDAPAVAPVACETTVEAKIDYDKIIYGAAEKVVESMPYPEKVDYRRIDESFANAAAAIPAPVASVEVKIEEEMIAAVAEKAAAAAVEKALAALDLDALAAAVAAKVVVPEVDYERLSDLVASKMTLPEVQLPEITLPEVPAPELDYNQLSDLVAEKLEVPEVELDYAKLTDSVADKIAATTEQIYEVVLSEEGLTEIAEKVADKVGCVENIDYDKVCQAAAAAQILPDPVDYDRIAEIVEDKVSNEDEPTYDLVIDEEGISAIAKGVSEELRNCCVCDKEETTEEVAEEIVVAEEVVEETIEETTEEVAEEVVETVEGLAQEVEEAVTPVEEEMAVAEEVVEETTEETVEEPAPVEETASVVEEKPNFEELNDQLVDAETGLVIRLKKSFTAKMKQSDEKVKGYYSDIKNELTSYKKINSNVSWHGDRFNFGRETIAKMNICGKTLCFYLSLDPNSPDYKTTVYHQKDVGAQKAYENTPFMVKIKSDAAAKKALRLVGYLAEKVGTTKEENFEAVDYVEEFAYESTKRLYEEGFIKATKEKKVDLDF